MNVALVVVTYNRLDYTVKTLERLLEDPDEEFDLYIWDNASRDGTVEYVKDGVKDSRIIEVVLSNDNVGQSGAMNYVWSKSKAELVGKLDNDCLVTPGWTRIFSKAHEDIEKLGTVACWNFPLEDFDEDLATKKICEFNGHRIFRHPATCGSGFIIKKRTFLEFGPWPEGAGTATTEYFYKMALAGYINGWYYPLVFQDHMDDPCSKYSRFHNMSFDEAYKNSFGYKFTQIKDMEEYMRIRKKNLYSLITDPYDPRYYVGWQKKIRRAVHRFNEMIKKL